MARNPETSWIVVYERISRSWSGHEVDATSRVDANKKFWQWAKAQPDDGMGYSIIATETAGGPRGLFVMDTKAKAKAKPMAINVIKGLLGHASLVTTLRYLQATKADAIAALTPKGGKPKAKPKAKRIIKKGGGR